MSVRVLLALGPDRGLEGALLEAAPEADLDVVARVVDVGSLRERVGRGGVDVIVLSERMQHLDRGLLAELATRRVPVVVVVHDVEHRGEYEAHAALVGVELDGPELAAAVAVAAARGIGYTASGEPDSGRDAPNGGAEVPPLGRVVAVTGPEGGPGRTTVACALADRLGLLGAHVVLVDCDPLGGGAAGLLGADPRIGLWTLVESGDGRLALDRELQLGRRHALLAGVAVPGEMARLGDEQLLGVLRQLAERFEWVICDWGARGAPLGPLVAAQEVLVVSRADRLGLWKTQRLLDLLGALPGIAEPALVVNARSRRDELRWEIERALGVPVLSVVREDSEGARRGIARYQPLSVAGGWRVRRDLERLAAALRARAAVDGSPLSRVWVGGNGAAPRVPVELIVARADTGTVEGDLW